MNRLSAGWGFGAAMCIAAVQGTHPPAWRAVAAPGGVRAIVDGVRARTESDSSARKSIVDAILLFDAQYVDRPDWRRIVLAALRESANLRPSGELEVAEKPDHLLLLHRGPEGDENSVSFAFSVTTSSEQVARYLAQAADFEKKFAHLGVPAIADAFIRGLNDLNRSRKDTSSHAPATGATEEVHANEGDPLPAVGPSSRGGRTRLFDFGSMPEKRQTQAFNVLFDQPDALARFRRIAKLAGPAGRRYALCARQELHPSDAEALGRNLLQSADRIEVGSSDYYTEQPVREVVVLALVQRLAAQFRHSREATDVYFKSLASQPPHPTAADTR